MSDRRVRVAFVILLVVSCAQVVWWIIDQRRLSESIESERLDNFEMDRRVAGELLSRGEDVQALAEMFPHLEFLASGAAPPNGSSTDGASGSRATEGVVTTIRIAADAREELARERRSHARQYGWESGFFLLVLLCCIWVLWRGLREEARLRKRHENFLASVSHELRSPLSSLRLQTETLQRRTLPAERQSQLLDRSEADIDRLAGLVDNVLEVARLDDDQGRALVRWDAEPIELKEAVAHQIRGLSGRLSESFDNRVGGDLVALADRQALDTILRNLLDNAARAIADGGDVVIEGEERDDHVRVRVKDSGIGFDPEESSHLFEKFYRPGDSLSRRPGGTGLGLYIVRHLVALGGGRVTAHSDGPGLGATFEVLLPAATDQAA